MLNELMRALHSFRRSYWWLGPPESHSVRAIVVNDENEFLLVLHRYQKGWFLPGGGVRRRELGTDAIRRVVREETGLSNLRIQDHLGTYHSQNEYKHDAIDVFVCRVAGALTPRRDLEIQEARSFPIADMPFDTSPVTRRRIAEYWKEAVITGKW